jgi:hypothetical protein
MIAIAPAQAVVIDFESLAHNDPNGFTTQGFSYTENGFTMTNSNGSSDAYLVWGTSSPYFPGSTTLSHNYANTTTTLSQVGGGAFTFSSIDLTDIYNQFDNITVDFTGNLSGGGTVFQSFTTNSSQGLETFNFTNFTNLDSVTWTPTENRLIQFDNINVNGSSTAVPEPFTVLGTLLGAGSSVALKRRLSKQDKQDIG